MLNSPLFLVFGTHLSFRLRQKGGNSFGGNKYVNTFISSSFAPVAQLDRASVCGTGGRAFESRRVYQENFEATLKGGFKILLAISSRDLNAKA